VKKMSGTELFLKGLLFTGSAVGLLLVITWWVYLSPMRRPVHLGIKPGVKLIDWIVGILIVSSICLVVGALWDASMHILTGEVPGGSDFLWPPHLLIYGSFLLSFLIACISIATIARAGITSGAPDPRQWVRANPYLGAVALASVFTLMSIPGDAIWHELFGIDLTAWSPPHMLLAGMSAAILVSAVGLLMQRPISKTQERIRNAAVFMLLGLMLNVLYIIGVLEWELPGGRSPFVDARPLWAYPLVGGALAFGTFILAKHLVRYRWAATMTALVFYLVRLTVTYGLGWTGNVQPLLPLPFILGALFLDILPWKPQANRWLRTLSQAATFTIGYALFALPLLFIRPDLPHFSIQDSLLTVLFTLVVTVFSIPILQLASQRLHTET
jgi:hypothetical protein